MKSRLYTYRIATLFFAMTLLIAVVSWVANVYELGAVQNLLSAEGIRWGLSHIVEDYVYNPALGVALVLLMGGGLFVYGGAYDAIKRICTKGKWVSRKERRALMVALLVLVVYVMLVLLNVMMPWTILRSITGTFEGSPLFKGWCYVASLGIGLSGAAYGCVSGILRNDADWVMAMSKLIALNADYLVTLFFVTQFFSTLEYTRMGEWMGVDAQSLYILYQAVCYLLLLLVLVVRGKNLNEAK